MEGNPLASVRISSRRPRARLIISFSRQNLSYTERYLPRSSPNIISLGISLIPATTHFRWFRWFPPASASGLPRNGQVISRTVMWRCGKCGALTSKLGSVLPGTLRIRRRHATRLSILRGRWPGTRARNRCHPTSASNPLIMQNYLTLLREHVRFKPHHAKISPATDRR